VEPGYEERFIGIDVPQTGEEPLIQKERLKRSAAVSQEMGEPLGGKLRRQRFRAQPPHHLLCVLFFQVKEGAGMLILFHLIEQKTARHTQMDDEGPTS